MKDAETVKIIIESIATIVAILQLSHTGFTSTDLATH